MIETDTIRTLFRLQNPVTPENIEAFSEIPPYQAAILILLAVVVLVIAVAVLYILRQIRTNTGEKSESVAVNTMSKLVTDEREDRKENRQYLKDLNEKHNQQIDNLIKTHHEEVSKITGYLSLQTENLTSLTMDGSTATKALIEIDRMVRDLSPTFLDAHYKTRSFLAEHMDRWWTPAMENFRRVETNTEKQLAALTHIERLLIQSLEQIKLMREEARKGTTHEAQIIVESTATIPAAVLADLPGNGTGDSGTNASGIPDKHAGTGGDRKSGD